MPYARWMLFMNALCRAAFIAGAMLLIGLPSAQGQSSLRLAVVSSISGVFEVSYGRPFLDGVRLAVEEANAAAGTRIVLDIQDDRGTEEGAREAATRIVATDALAVVGPPLSTSSLAAGPVFAKAGLASIVSTVESDLVTDNATTFRASFKNSDLGASLANHLRHALGGKQAAVIFADNAYGRTIADGFRRGAERLGLTATFHGFKTAAERDEAARLVAADPGRPAIVLAMLEDDAVPVMVTLRRAGTTAPVLGPTGMGNESFADKFKDLPEEQRTRGFFTRGVYAAVPVILDSANAETLAFAERFHARFGKDQAAVSWLAVQGYDAARLAIAALREAAPGKAAADVAGRREAVRAFLLSLDSPAHAVAGLLGPLWFTPDRGRDLPIRVGHFNRGRFESAPLQLVPVTNPEAREIASGALVEIGAGQYARRQQVVYTGIYLNEIPRMDIAQSFVTADVYVWIRYASGVASGTDPTQVEFPDLVRGSFDPAQPVAKRDLDDGMTYRLWRLHGDFKSDFDLHRYPADLQRLVIRFFNPHAASNRVIYVLDRSLLDPSGVPQPHAMAAGAREPGARQSRDRIEPRRSRSGRHRAPAGTVGLPAHGRGAPPHRHDAGQDGAADRADDPDHVRHLLLSAGAGRRQGHGGDHRRPLGRGAAVVDQFAARQCWLRDRRGIRLLRLLRALPALHRDGAAGREAPPRRSGGRRGQGRSPWPLSVPDGLRRHRRGGAGRALSPGGQVRAAQARWMRRPASSRRSVAVA